MITEVPQSGSTKYVVKINGQVLSPTYPSRQLAESFVFQLSSDKQAIAEIVSVTGDGKQILFG